MAEELFPVRRVLFAISVQAWRNLLGSDIETTIQSFPTIGSRNEEDFEQVPGY